jgi:peptide/nickel transport system permease protein
MTDLAAGVIAGTIAPRRRFVLLSRLTRHRSFQIGLAIVAILALAAIFAPLLTSVDPSSMKVRFRFKPASSVFPFGTDISAGTFSRACSTGRAYPSGSVSSWPSFRACLARPLVFRLRSSAVLIRS